MNERARYHAPDLDPAAVRLREETILCFGWSEWGPGNQTWNHVLRRLARRNRVLYVPPPLERTEVFGNRFAPGGGSGGLHHREHHLYVYRYPRLLPNFYRPALLTRSIEAMRIRALRKILRSLGAKRPILYLLHPKFRNYIGAFDEKLVLYHVLDEYSGYLGANRKRLGREETLLLDEADLILCASHALAESKAAEGRDVHFVPNGVDYDLISPAAAGGGTIPPDLAHLPSPRAGYLGRICDKLDFRLLLDVARLLPGVSFCFAGPVHLVTGENREIFDRWAELPNVHLLGSKSIEDLPAVLGAFDVGLMPYEMTEEGKQRYPLKLHEYLAAGKPVVSVPLPCFEGFHDLVRTGRDPGEWASAIREALDDRSPASVARRMEVAERHDWERIVFRIDELIRGALVRPRDSAAVEKKA